MDIRIERTLSGRSSSWGGLPVLAIPHGMPAKQDVFIQMWPVVFLPYLMGPLLSGLALTGIVDGAAGWKHLGARWFAGDSCPVSMQSYYSPPQS